MFGLFLFSESDVEPCWLHNEEIEPDKIVRVTVMLIIISFEFSGWMQWLTNCFCLAFRTDDVEGLELIRWEDQQKVRSYVQSGGPPDTTPATSKFTTKECGIEVSPTSRATCKQCSQKILKTEVGNNVSLPFLCSGSEFLYSLWQAFISVNL